MHFLAAVQLLATQEYKLEPHIFNSNKRHFLSKVALSFSILSLVACSQEKSVSSDAVVIDPKASQQIDIFQAPKITNQSNQAFKASDLKLVGILIAASGENSAVISIGVSGQVSTYRVGDEVSQGIKIVSISSDEVVVSDRGDNYRIAMNRAIKNEQSPLGKMSQSEVTGNPTSTGLPPGMMPMSPNTDTRPSANNEFREIINQRFQK
jgi:Tfp pilus assembly protein PilP